MPEAILEKTSRVPAAVPNIARRTAAAIHAIDDGIEVVKLTGKKCSDAAEELMDDNVQRIKRHPLESIVTMFVVGFVAGGFVDWMLRRN